MTAKLIAEEGLLKELVLSLDEGEQWIIGRDPDACQLLVEDPAASRQHALCRKTDQGIVIENLSKINPVLVNDEPLTDPRLLQQGDLIKIGDTLFRFYYEEAAHVYEEPITTSNNDEPEETESDTLFHEDVDDLAHVSFDLMETGRWLLKVVGGPNNGAEFSMQTDHSYVIGTDPNTCDIVFYDTSVSRQHARITVSSDDTITIEDLKSRNGTRIEGLLISSPQPLPLNTLVNIGTSSFVVYDREGEMQTIISPLLPSIVKALQKEEVKEPEEPSEVAPKVAPPVVPEAPKAPSHSVGTFLLTAILIGIFALAGIAIKSLFTQEEVVTQQPVDIDQELANALKAFPDVKYSFNKSTGRLLLVGHVLSSSDKSELLYNLQGLKFIREMDDSGVIIDEYVWNEANQLISRNPNWRGITVHSPSSGHFILSGYLQTHTEAEQLWDYMTRNFAFLDLLENKVVVEEDILSTVQAGLRERGINSVTPQLGNNGELTLTGGVANEKKAEYDQLLEQFKSIPGVRSVKNFASEVAKQEAVINISSKYSVSGISKTSGGKLTVVINGRILSQGDTLDGMTITSIQPNMVLLEREGVTYRVDISR